MTARIRIDAPACPGPLVLYEVAGDERHEPAGLLYCTHCGWMSTHDQPVDEAHVWTPLRADLAAQIRDGKADR